MSSAAVRVTTLLMLSAGILASTRALAEDWSQWRGANRDGSTQTDVPLRRDLPPGGLRPLWINTEDFGGGGWSSPVVAGGRIYVYSHEQMRRDDVKLPPPKFPPLTDEQKAKLSPEQQRDYEQKRGDKARERTAQEYRFVDRMVCASAATGEPLWKADRTSGQTHWRQSSTPAVQSNSGGAGGRVYYVGADRSLVCLDAADGQEQWAAKLPVGQEDISPITSSPLVVDGLVVVLAERLIALDAGDGSLVWMGAARQEGAIYSSPALWTSGGQRRIIANMADVGTVCVDAGDGEELWRVDSGGGRSSPVVAGDLLVTYAGSRKGGLRCYRLTDDGAELLWKHQRVADQGSSPVVAEGRVFVQGDRHFACVDLKEGKPVWTTTLDRNSPRYTSPVAADGLVLYTFGGVIAVDADAGAYEPLFDARLDKQGVLAQEQHIRKLLKIDDLERTEEGQKQAQQLWRQEVEAHGPRDCVSPAVAGGRLYLRVNRGVVCYDLAKGDER